MVSKHLRLIFVLLLLPLSGALAAKSPMDPLPSPSGRVILSVSGAIAVTNASQSADFDRKLLESLPQHTMTTTTKWTDGEQTFEGVLLRDLISALGAEGKTLTATALNDYQVEIPASDADEYPVLLATKQNGKAMRVRNKGPIWIIYPDDAPDNARFHRMIWQLRKLHVD